MPLARAAAFKGYDDRIYVCVNIKSKEMMWVMLSLGQRAGRGRTNTGRLSIWIMDEHFSFNSTP
jgi:hypothetical protein